jgi:HEAT repeat protein
MLKRHLAFLVPLFYAALMLAEEPSQPPTPLITQTPDKLVAVLESSASRKEKADACRELAVVGTSSAVPALARLLADEELCHMALYALETMPDSSVNRTLRSELRKLHGRQLVGVIGSLGVRKDLKAVKPLAALLGNADPEVAQAAARALGRIGTAQAAKAILTKLPAVGPETRLACGEGCLRYVERLAADGKVPQVIAMYDHLRLSQNLPWQVRSAALRGAILSRGTNDLGLLTASLRNADYLIFSTALQATMEMPAPEVTRALAACLSRLPKDSRVAVVQSLGERGDAEAMPSLRLVLMDQDPVIRLAALRAVAAIGGTSAVSIMLGNVFSNEPELASAAKDGLAGIPGPEADAAAISMLNSKQTDRRIIGIELIGRRRITGEVPSLIRASSDPDAKVRLAALRCLGEIGEPGDVPALNQLVLRATETPDREAGADALETLLRRAGKPESATDQIASAMTQAQPKQKCAFLGVLCSLGGTKALSAVRGTLNDPDPEVRDAAVRALADWTDPAATQDLLKLLGSTTETTQERELVFRGYVRLARDPVNSATQKFKMLCEAATAAVGPQELKLVLSGLGEVTSVESLRLVAARLSDSQMAEEAGAAAVKIADALNAKYKEDIAPVLNEVLKVAKSQRLIDQARKRMEQLGIPREINGS